MILRRNYPQVPLDIATRVPPPDPSIQQYELLLEFDLKRQKQKNMILEERLKNKQVFIQQMKHFQQQLTVAYEQCKNELVLAQEKIQYLQNVEFREYTEQIADLKHMLHTKTQESKRNSNSREDRFTMNNHQTKLNRNRSEKGLTNRFSDRRESKGNSRYGTQRERSASERFQLEISKQVKKSANFIAHFIQMAECYVSQLSHETKLTKKLKKSWKWIKQVVKQWDVFREESLAANSFKKQLVRLLKTEKDTDQKTLIELVAKAIDKS